MGSTLDGTPCAMLQISCKSFSPLIRIILSFAGIETQASWCININNLLLAQGTNSYQKLMARDVNASSYISRDA